ncbi:MAG: DUF3849 domain-containing protein [Clostridia bacterium]|nr:DUF3849 domain-containing protein [Clostridia bacterium]
MAVPFFRYSFETAKDMNMIDEYKKSNEETLRCIDYIQDSETGLYANAYKDYIIDKGGVYTDHLIKEFGLERMMFIAASTVKTMPGDGRWSAGVKEWAETFNAGLRHNEKPGQYALHQIHVGIVDILAAKLINRYNDLKLFDASHCEEEQCNMKGKVVVLSRMALKEEYWTPENQLWLATGGFGCSPTASGRAVYATCLYDGENTRWERHQIAGVLKDEFMPDWAREKLNEIKNPEQSDGIEFK